MYIIIIQFLYSANSRMADRCAAQEIYMYIYIYIHIYICIYIYMYIYNLYITTSDKISFKIFGRFAVDKQKTFLTVAD